jgi:N-acyl-D-amino-acid deacylase
MREAPVADYDIIIKGGTVVDGTRTPRYLSDIAIKDGKIAQIGGLKGKTAERVLDAAGRIVAPGFVDLHTHYDAQIFWDPYCTLSGWHGVTSVALGNCGFGFAPSRVEDRDRAMLSMTRNEAIPYEAMRAGMPWNWVTFPDFIESLSRTPKRRQLPYLRAVDPSLCLGDGLGGSQKATADRGGTRGNVPVDP